MIDEGRALWDEQKTGLIKLRRLPGFVQRYVVRNYLIDVAMPNSPEATKEAVKNYW